MPPFVSLTPTNLAAAAYAPAAVRVTHNNAAVPSAGKLEVGSDSAATNSGVHIHISPAALEQAQAASPNQDIDDSDLPDTIKDLLKMIREIKAQLLERTQALQQLMTDSKLSDEERNLQAQQLQTEINGLNTALNTALAQLLKTLKMAGLSQAQSSQAAALAAS